MVLHSACSAILITKANSIPVMAHEISHVTQRHLARAMEDQKRNAPLTWVGALGSILLAMASPQAGMAALTGTLAGTRQGMISFTQQNEQEADRIGIQVLQRSGFDPQAMPMFMEKLLDQARYSSRPPEILLTHPLPESRLSDARNRANQMRPVVAVLGGLLSGESATLGMYNGGRNKLTSDLLDALGERQRPPKKCRAVWSRSYRRWKASNCDEARKTLQPLLNADPNNARYLDLATDIDLGQKKPATPSIALKTLASCAPTRCCS